MLYLVYVFAPLMDPRLIWQVPGEIYKWTASQSPRLATTAVILRYAAYRTRLRSWNTYSSLALELIRLL